MILCKEVQQRGAQMFTINVCTCTVFHHYQVVNMTLYTRTHPWLPVFYTNIIQIQNSLSYLSTNIRKLDNFLPLQGKCLVLNTASPEILCVATFLFISTGFFSLCDFPRACRVSHKFPVRYLIKF